MERQKSDQSPCNYKSCVETTSELGTSGTVTDDILKTLFDH